MISEDELLSRWYPKTREEWWFLFDRSKKDIDRMMINFFNPHELNDAREHIKNKDANKLWMSLNKLWCRLPESPAVRTFPGFNALCDLCSDFPEKEESIKEGVA